jgi:predicted nucleotide-binding protein
MARALTIEPPAPTAKSRRMQTDLEGRPVVEAKPRGRPPSDVPTFPRDSLKEAVAVAEAIKRDGAGESLDVVLLANSIGVSRRSRSYEELLRSAARYGLTEGTVYSKDIKLTELGRAIVAPTDDSLVGSSMRKALMTPSVFSKFYAKYDRNSIPRDVVIKNILEQQFSVRRADVDACFAVLMKNIEEQGLKLAQGRDMLLWLSNLGKPMAEPEQGGPGVALVEESGSTRSAEGQENPNASPETTTRTSQVPKQVFLAHGKNKKPLEQLKGILNQFKVPYQVAVEEPNKGKVIPAKVQDLMRQCSSGIFIFTGDEELVDSGGNKVVRPNDNVVFELGAGVALYGDKIVILREDGVTFGSDFDSYGRITFEKDKLDAKGLDIMKELIGMGFLQVQAA